MLSDNKNMTIVTPHLIKENEPYRPLEGHKGMFGTLSVRVGSLGMGGASLLCGRAALSSGVGLVRFFSNKDMVAPLLMGAPEAVTDVFPEQCERRIRLWRSILKKISAVVIGPGLHPDEKDILNEILFLVEHAPRLLLDAGAITVISRFPDQFDDALRARKEKIEHPVILTPHPGECARLIPGWDKTDRTSLPSQYAQQKGIVLVLKGYKTVVFTPKTMAYLNTTGNNGLAKAGSGDVLSGIIGGFLAQNIDESVSAFSGVYFHGLAGDIIAERKGVRAMQPTDLINALPDAYDACGWK